MMLGERPSSLAVGSKQLKTPTYFPSISSVKTSLRPLDYLSVLSTSQGLTDKYLASAFDLLPLKEGSEAKQCIDAARNNGGVVLMDSGNYESFWKNAQDVWKQADFHATLDAFPCDLAFGFDEQAPPEDENEHVALVVARWELDQGRAGDCRIIPIVHGSQAALPELCRKIAEQTG
jgi:hypothetical protein